MTQASDGAAAGSPAPHRGAKHIASWGEPVRPALSVLLRRAAPGQDPDTSVQYVIDGHLDEGAHARYPLVIARRRGVATGVMIGS